MHAKRANGIRSVVYLCLRWKHIICLAWQQIYCILKKCLTTFEIGPTPNQSEQIERKRMKNAHPNATGQPIHFTLDLTHKCTHKIILHLTASTALDNVYFRMTDKLNSPFLCLFVSGSSINFHVWMMEVSVEWKTKRKM